VGGRVVIPVTVGGVSPIWLELATITSIHGGLAAQSAAKVVTTRL
jgi:hypothetical protein